MRFIMPQKVMFKHCDPAGIVFYPRYFEMMNDCVEMFFEQILGCPFETLHDFGGVPTAEISVQFKAVSRLGDRLKISLKCVKIGRSSLGLETLAHCGDELRFAAKSTLVFVNLDGRPTPWPDDMRAKLEQQMKEETDE